MEYKWFILLFWTHKLKSFSLFKNTSNTSFNSIFLRFTVDVKKFSFPPISIYFRNNSQALILKGKEEKKISLKWSGKIKSFRLFIINHKMRIKIINWFCTKRVPLYLIFNWMLDGAFESCLGNYSIDFISIIWGFKA